MWPGVVVSFRLSVAFGCLVSDRWNQSTPLTLSELIGLLDFFLAYIVRAHVPPVPAYTEGGETVWWDFGDGGNPVRDVWV